MKQISSHTVRWIAVGIGVLWLIGMLQSNFLAIAESSGLPDAYYRAWISGPSYLKNRSTADCELAQLEASIRGGVSFCKAGPARMALFTVSVNGATIFALMSVVVCLFLAAKIDRATDYKA